MSFLTQWKKRPVAAVAASLLFALSAHGLQPIAQAGFRHFYNLEYDQALTLFQEEIASRPGQPEGYNHLAQTILYRGLYKSGILENSLASGDDLLLSLIRQPKLALAPTDEKEFQRAVNAAVGRAESQLRKDPNDAAALYALGAAYGLRANYDFLVRKAWFAAIRGSNAARGLHNRASRLDPGNVDARMMQGVHEYVVAGLPAVLRVLGSITGLRGDKEAGLRLLEMVASQGADSKVEAQMLLATLYRHEKQPQTAMSFLNHLRQSYPRNYLLHMAEVYTSIEMRDEKAAADSLQSLERSVREGAPGYALIEPAKIAYARGVLQCRFGHFDQALQSMRHAATTAGSEGPEIRLLAYERLGMIHDLRGQRQLALQAYQKVVDAAPDSRLAREAQRYLARPFRGCDSD